MGENHEKTKEFFKNSIKIKINYKKFNVMSQSNNNIDSNPKNIIGRLEILEALKVIIDIQFIKRINQCKNNFTWLILLDDCVQASAIYNKSIEIHGITVLLESPDDDYINHTYKVMWMPPAFPVRLAADSLCGKDGTIMEIKELMVKEEQYKKIGTGVYNITIRYPFANKIDLCSLTGVKNIAGQKIFIIRYGEEVRCLFCNNPGHEKKNCEKLKLKCPTCNKKDMINVHMPQ